MPLLVAAAAAGGYALGTKVLSVALIGLGSAFAYFAGSQSNREADEDEKDKLDRDAQERSKKRETHLDNIVDNTHQHTATLRQRHDTHTQQMQEATTTLAEGSALWQQEGQQLQQMVSQLRSIIAEKEQQLQQVSQQLQPEVNALPTISHQLAQSQWLLNERQNDLKTMIELLTPLLQQLEARNRDWLEITQRLQTLEATQSTHTKTLTKAGQRQAELVAEVNRLEDELKGAMGTIKQLETTKKAYREKLESLTGSQQHQGHPAYVPANPRFFNTKQASIHRTSEDYHATHQTTHGKTRD
ncbi:hypothetical protein [Legionella sp.]|uniref:hypothetical protein n=1 Tax=Legionella sp. TaxID=459 RepID=UPI00321F8FA1